VGAEAQLGYLLGRFIRGCIILLFKLVGLILLGVWHIVAFPFRMLFGRRSQKTLTHYMVCPTCGLAYEHGARFCPTDGSELVLEYVE
jgi:hypothetical protein